MPFALALLWAMPQGRLSQLLGHFDVSMWASWLGVSECFHPCARLRCQRCTYFCPGMKGLIVLLLDYHQQPSGLLCLLHHTMGQPHNICWHLTRSVAENGFFRVTTEAVILASFLHLFLPSCRPHNNHMAQKVTAEVVKHSKEVSHQRQR